MTFKISYEFSICTLCDTFGHLAQKRRFIGDSCRARSNQVSNKSGQAAGLERKLVRDSWLVGPVWIEAFQCVG